MKKIQLLASAMLTALVIGGPVNAATTQQLQTIQQLAASGDIRALRRFLAANPEMTFSPEMAAALTEFVEQTNGIGGIFASRDVLADVVVQISEEPAVEPTATY